MNLDINKFNPTVKELKDLAKKYDGLEIKGIEDKDGYKLVDSARKDLKRRKVDIKKQGKSFRAEALKFQKEVIQVEKDLVRIIVNGN